MQIKGMIMKKDFLNVLEKEFIPMGEITEKIREENRNRYFSGSVRVQNSHYRTTEEYDLYKKQTLARKLP